MPYRPYAQRSSNRTLDNQIAQRDMAAEREVRRAISRKLREERRAKGDFDPPKPVAIRPITIDDASHVIDSWVKAYRRSPTVGPVEPTIFHIEQRARINRLIQRSKTVIACDEADKALIRGWIVFEAPRTPTDAPVVHFVCVHPSYQCAGIGTALVEVARKTHPDPEAPMWSTHDTMPMKHIRPKWNLLYNPYLLEVDHRQAAKTAVASAQGIDPYAF